MTYLLGSRLRFIHDMQFPISENITFTKSEKFQSSLDLLETAIILYIQFTKISCQASVMLLSKYVSSTDKIVALRLRI